MPKTRASQMPSAPSRRPALFCAGLLVMAYLGGCAVKPEGPKPADTSQSTIEKFQRVLEPGITLDYQVEKKISRVNSKSCYAFITGKLNNVSGSTLSKRTVLDIAVIGQGKQLFRDNTSPLADIPTGFNAVFEMVVSPIFADGCPRFDQINIALRKVTS